MYIQNVYIYIYIYTYMTNLNQCCPSWRYALCEYITKPRITESCVVGDKCSMYSPWYKHGMKSVQRCQADTARPCAGVEKSALSTLGSDPWMPLWIAACVSYLSLSRRAFHGQSRFIATQDKTRGTGAALMSRQTTYGNRAMEKGTKCLP